MLICCLMINTSVQFLILSCSFTFIYYVLKEKYMYFIYLIALPIFFPEKIPPKNTKLIWRGLRTRRGEVQGIILHVMYKKTRKKKFVSDQNLMNTCVDFQFQKKNIEKYSVSIELHLQSFTREISANFYVCIFITHWIRNHVCKVIV